MCTNVTRVSTAEKETGDDILQTVQYNTVKMNAL